MFVQIWIIKLSQCKVSSGVLNVFYFPVNGHWKLCSTYLVYGRSCGCVSWSLSKCFHMWWRGKIWSQVDTRDTLLHQVWTEVHQTVHMWPVPLKMLVEARCKQSVLLWDGLCWKCKILDILRLILILHAGFQSKNHFHNIESGQALLLWLSGAAF